MSQDDENIVSSYFDQADKPSQKIDEITTSQFNWPLLILEGLTEAVFSLDQNWCFAYLNQAAAAVWGLSKESLLGKSVWEEFPTLVGSKLETVYRSAMTDETPVTTEQFSQTTQQWYEVRLYPIPEGLICYFLDITSRKQTEFALQESEKRFKVLSEAAYEGLILHDRGIIQETNQSMAELSGYSREELIGMSVAQLLAPEERAAFLQRIAENYGASGAEGVALRKDGTRYFMESRGKLVEYQGKTMRLVAVRDVTQLKQAQQQLKESEERYRMLSEATFEGIVLYQNRIIVDANQTMAAMFGFSNPAEVVGLPIRNFIAPESLADVQRRTVESDEEPYEAVALKRDGTRFVVEARNKAITYRGQTLRVGALQDITERKQREQELAESRLRFKVLSEATTEGILFHYNGTIREANLAMAKLLGFERPDELLGLNIYDFEVPASRELSLHYVRARREDVYEIVMIRKDGSEVAVEVQGKNIEYQGQPARQGAFRDLTERKQREQELRESEYRYRVLSEATLEGVAIYQNNVVVEANEGLARMLGYASAEEIIGFSITHHLTPASRKEVEATLAANETGQGIEITVVSKDGREFIAETYGYSINYKGQPASVGIIRDITARKQQEQQLRESEERFRVLSEAAFDAVTMQENGIICEVNNATLELTGYSREELIGTSLVKLITPESLQNLQQRYGRGYIGAFEIVGLRKDGTTYPAEGRRQLAIYQGRQVAVSTIRDVSDKVELLRTQGQLAQAQKMESIGRLAGGIAHDFNNLLTVIINYCELGLLLLDKPTKVADAFTEIQKAGERAADLTRQLLAFSRQQVLQPKIIDLNTVVTNAIKMLQRLIGEDIELVSSFEPNLAKTLADPGQVEQIILNLVVNARDAITLSRGGKITIETANVELDDRYRLFNFPQFKSGNYVMLAVSDNGSGMDEATQEKIFEPFFTTKEPGKGTGLGLATVFGIVKQSEGYIWVYSRVGLGTTFKVYLPIAEETDVANRTVNLVQDYKTLVADTQTGLQTDTKALIKVNQKQAHTILVVEDEGMIRDLIEQILEQAGYNLITVNNGQEALEKVAASPNKIDLVLTDIVMPSMGGHELTAELRKRLPELKIIGMSGYTDQAVQQHKLLEDYDSFIQKPFTQKQLLNNIKTLLTE